MSSKKSRQAKIVPKRTKLIQKLAYILRPFVVYMLVKTFAMLFLAIAIPALPITGISEWVEQNSNPLSAAVNGAASMIAVCFLLKDFLIETDTSGEIDIDRGTLSQLVHFFKNGFLGYEKQKEKKGKKAEKMFLCIALGVSTSFILNLLMELFTKLIQGQGTLGSEKYEVVETIQYSVPIWLGILLYGVISPLVEEMVFRGVVYNRIKRFYNVPKAVVCSALLFGMFHGNLPQFLYGTVMGIIIALCYEHLNCFAAPVLVHMSANIFVFLLASLTV
ncbi:MAG: CPBP family intramembrane metalloprotease [Lachnospiraceae bacterium]|nr:CPBP family intramembrane metalloprotease [Lachnospiraceae bacterium]